MTFHRALLAPAIAARHGLHEYFSQVRRALAAGIVDWLLAISFWLLAIGFAELWLMSNKLQLLGNAKAFFVATDANAPRRR